MLTVSELREKALQIAQSGDFFKTFSVLTESYKDSSGGEQENIMTLLTEIFYSPNCKALQENYEKNRSLLQKYSYWFGPKIPEFSDLNVKVFPIDSTACFLYQKMTNDFFEMEIGSEKETKCFFNSLSKPLLIEDETNEYNLRFLADNVRASEDVAMDNHIYLYYKRPEILFALLQIADFSPLLEGGKFVLLAGKENRNRYCIDFKKNYGIDYKAMRPALLRTEEIKRIIPLVPFGYSGTFFLCQIFNANKEIVMFHAYHFFNGLNIRKIYDTLITCLNDDSYRIGYEKLIGAIGEELRFFLAKDHAVFFDLLREISADKQMTVPEWFKAICIAKYYTENGKDHVTRISPTIFWDYHYGAFEDYQKIYNTFPYMKIMSILRDPVIRFGRWLKYALKYRQNTSPSSLTHLYKIGGFDAARYEGKYYCVKFEDLKKQPLPGAKRLCEFMNVPFDKEMMHSEKYPLTSFVENEYGERLVGFDPRSLTRNLDDIYSDLDKLRLVLFYEPILKKFGYDYPANYRPGSEEEARALFSLPYRFEDLLQLAPPGSSEQVRKEIANVLFEYYYYVRNGGDVRYPELISINV